jgi:hypothetical protein
VGRIWHRRRSMHGLNRHVDRALSIRDIRRRRRDLHRQRQSTRRINR